MKKIFLFVSLALSANAVLAQDTYLNDRMTATDDVIGTSRFVGMGGAMGALGADLSTISSNPAGLGLYRKSDVSLTAGAITPNGNGWSNTATGERKTHASFDQMGLVWSNRLGGKLKYINAAFNYQKKINYNQAFYADNQNLGHLSQMDQLAELANGANGESYATDYNLAGAAAYYEYIDKDQFGYFNRFSGENSEYTRHSTGGVQSFDFNVSFNVNDRFYTGLTIGCDNLNYRGWSEYKEFSSTAQGELGDYKLANDRHVDGAGVNFKLGFIARPFEQNSFRVGLAIETPTWYHLKSSTLYALDNNDADEAYMEYNVTSPAKVRLSMGSTVDKYFAWGAEYEFANYGRTRMSYSDYDWYGYGTSSADKAMNQLTENTLKGQHTLRLGVEGKPCDAVALRLGYNYVTNRFKTGAHLDQFDIDSKAMDYATTTDFMNLSDVNILTAGIGFKYKFFYCDLAYKFRAQHGDFYPFDCSFTSSGSDFAIDNPGLADTWISPTKVNLNRHQVAMTVGFKF